MRCGRNSGWQEDGEHGPGPIGGLGFQPQFTAVPLHKVIANPQAQTGSRISLAGHKRLENVTPDSIRNTAAAVGNDDAHPAHLRITPIQRRFAGYADASPRRSGVDGIADNVGKQLPQLIGEGLNSIRLSQIGTNLKIASLELGIKQVQQRLSPKSPDISAAS